VRKVMTAVFVILMLPAVTTQLFAEDANLSIYEIQYTENPDGSSYYDQQYVNCNGGIVIHKYQKGTGMQRVFLYDPNHPDGWGGIQVRADVNSLLDDVNVGDWISLENVLVSDPAFNEADPYKARGNTILFYDDSSSSYAVLNTDNSLPEPLPVLVSEISAPVYDDFNDTWFVIDHGAEKYEGMYLKIIDVAVGEMELGKATDNYVLYKANDPNICCWASDYMNIDKPPDPNEYLQVVQTGQHFCGVNGILEQYTKLSDGWDYYQLLTTSIDDFVIEQTADLDGDCDVDFVDFGLFAYYWLTEEQCSEPDWCGGADFTQDEYVNIFDLRKFSENWLAGKY